jgi:UTP--glucose-1-phosphate uridylyltransferase
VLTFALANTIPHYFSHDPELEDHLTTINKIDRLKSLLTILDQAKFTFVYQTKDFPYGNGSPILVAENFIGSDPFIYCWGDDLTIEDQPGKFLSSMIAAYDQYHPAVVLAVQEVPRSEINRYGSVAYVNDPQYPHRISGIVEKPEPDQAPSLFAQGGRFIVSPQIIPVLKTQQTTKGELWFTEAENTLAQSQPILALPYQDAFWTTTGDPLNWLKANITLALKDPVLSEPIKAFLQSQNLHTLDTP